MAWSTLHCYTSNTIDVVDSAEWATSRGSRLFYRKFGTQRFWHLLEVIVCLLLSCRYFDDILERSDPYASNFVTTLKFNLIKCVVPQFRKRSRVLLVDNNARVHTQVTRGGEASGAQCRTLPVCAGAADARPRA